MSFFSKLFGGSGKSTKAPTAGEAIQRLREVEEMLVKKQEYLEKKVQQELTIAKKNGTKNKRVALQALKRKKRYDKQLGQIDGTLTTIEYQREALENANTNTEVLRVMGVAAKALERAHGSMDVEDVHKLMDDVQEQQDISNEIADALGRSLGPDQDYDEDELARELEELEQEELDEELLKVPSSVAVELPSPPKAEPVPTRPARRKDKVPEYDDDMKELAEWGAGT